MAQKFQLAIGDRFTFPVHLKVRDGADTKDFKFQLEGKRLDSETARKVLTGEGESSGMTVQEFLRENITGWRSQRVVLDEEGQPAEYSTEALDSMLTISGVPAVLYQAFVLALGATSGAEGARKN